MAKAFKLRIETDAAAFDPENGGAPYEVARILRQLADEIETRNKIPDSQKLYDFNGNRCGVAQIGGRL